MLNSAGLSLLISNVLLFLKIEINESFRLMLILAKMSVMLLQSSFDKMRKLFNFFASNMLVIFGKTSLTVEIQ